MTLCLTQSRTGWAGRWAEEARLSRNSDLCSFHLRSHCLSVYLLVHWEDEEGEIDR